MCVSGCLATSGCLLLLAIHQHTHHELCYWTCQGRRNHNPQLSLAVYTLNCQVTPISRACASLPLVGIRAADLHDRRSHSSPTLKVVAPATGLSLPLATSPPLAGQQFDKIPLEQGLHNVLTVRPLPRDCNPHIHTLTMYSQLLTQCSTLPKT